MIFTNPLFQLLLVTGALFVAAGLLLFLFPPKQINGLYGYRTKRSMRSQAAWDFAQKYGASRLIYLGLALMAASTVGLLIDMPYALGVGLGLGLLLIGLVLMFRHVEQELKRRFPEEG